jgi:hypothetical protein
VRFGPRFQYGPDEQLLQELRKAATGFCLSTNPGSAGAAYGYGEMGPYNQAGSPSSA